MKKWGRKINIKTMYENEMKGTFFVLRLFLDPPIEFSAKGILLERKSKVEIKCIVAVKCQHSSVQLVHENWIGMPS